MGHAADPDTQSASGALELDDATRIAQTMGVLSTSSRVRLLACLRDGPASVTELARIADMQQSAASHQLRVLRHLRLVTTAAGRSRPSPTSETRYLAAGLDTTPAHLAV
jgi:DNA-binding transcriptional ArsR family regulator